MRSPQGRAVAAQHDQQGKRCHILADLVRRRQVVAIGSNQRDDPLPGQPGLDFRSHQLAIVLAGMIKDADRLHLSCARRRLRGNASDWLC